VSSPVIIYQKAGKIKFDLTGIIHIFELDIMDSSSDIRGKNETRSYNDVESVAASFLPEISEKTGEKTRVHVFHGKKEIGKSLLCSELYRLVESEKSRLQAYLDFNKNQNKELDGFLLALRNHFNKEFDAVFPSFDIAYSIYIQKTNPDKTPIIDDKPLLDGKGPMKSILRSAGGLPGKGFVPILSGIFATPGNRYKEWWNKRGKTELANLLPLEPKDILPKLLFLWVDDFKDFLETTKKDAIIFLNACELPDAGSDTYYSFLTENQLKQFIQRLDGVMFVITSVSELDWKNKDKNWSGILKNIKVDRYLERSTSGYLKQHGIENAGISALIGKECKDNPFLLNLSIDICREIKRAEKRQPEAEDFKNFCDSAVEKLLSLLDKSETETLKILSFAENWDNALFSSLISYFNTGYKSDRRKNLTRFTFVKESELSGFYEMDDKFSELMKRRGGIQEPEKIYKFLFGYHNDLIKNIDYSSIKNFDKKVFRNAFQYAKNIFGFYELANWFFSFVDRFKNAGQYRFLLPFINDLANILKESDNGEAAEYSEMLLKCGIYYKEIGRYKDAETLLRRSLTNTEAKQGTESREYAACLMHLADVLFGQGEYAEAEPLYLKSIVLLNPLGEKESAFSMQSLMHVAILFARQGKFEKAIPLFEKILKVRTKTHGEEHPDVLRIQTNIANIEFERKNYGNAESLYRKILDLKKIYYGDNHPEVSKAMINLGNLLIELKNYSETSSLYERAKEIFEEFYGSEHPDYAMTLNNLAYLNFVTGNFNTSKKYYLLALNIYRNVLGNEHPDLAILYNNIGRLYTKMKNFTEAERFIRDSLGIKIKKFGFDNPETGNSYESLAELYESTGNIKEALFYYKKYGEILKSQFPQDNPETQLIMNKISTLKGE